MSRQASKIDFIAPIKTRGLHWNDKYSAAYAVEAQIQRLVDTSKVMSSDDLELWKYFPIAAVTCLENSTRWAIYHLVESGEPFRTRATDLLTGNFTIKNLMPLIGRQITLGDLAAHSVSVNSLQNIDSHLSVLIGLKSEKKIPSFLQELKKAQSFDSSVFGDVSENDGDESLLLPSPDLAIAAVKEIFEIRHIIVHELTPCDIVNPRKLQNLLEQVARFIAATHQFCLELGEPGSTASFQASMNINANYRYEESLKEMSALVEAINQCLSKSKQRQLQRAQAHFANFIKAESQFYINPFEGGSAAPMMVAGYSNRVVKTRIDQLRDHLNFLTEPTDYGGSNDSLDIATP